MGERMDDSGVANRQTQKSSQGEYCRRFVDVSQLISRWYGWNWRAAVGTKLPSGLPTDLTSCRGDGHRRVKGNAAATGTRGSATWAEESWIVEVDSIQDLVVIVARCHRRSSGKFGRIRPFDIQPAGASPPIGMDVGVVKRVIVVRQDLYRRSPRSKGGVGLREPDFSEE